MKKEWKIYGLTTILVFIILVFLYTQLDAYSNTFFISDAYSQYAALMTRLREILLGHESLFYSFEGGLGSSFLGTFFYYLCSPFNLLLIFFKDIEKFFLVTTFLKLLTCSLTALYFFRYHFRDKPKIYAVAFSTFYLFIGFTSHYFIHLMWLDSVLILPLLLVGIDKFIKEKKIFLYLFALLYSIITNYYFGFMSCLFSFLYFFYQVLITYSLKEEKKKILTISLQYLLLTFLGVLTTSFVLLEVLHEIPEYARVSTEMFGGEAFSFHGGIISFLENFLISNTNDIEFLNADGFYLYTGLCPILLIVLYFFNSHFSKKEKILTLAMIGILYLSVSGNYFNYAWTAFSKPQFFNGRFTFFFSFFFLYIAFQSLMNLSTLKKKDYLLTLLSFTIFFFGFYFKTEKTSLMYINLAVFLIYCFLLKNIDSPKMYMPLVLASCLILEGISNTLVSTSDYTYTKKEEYQNQNLKYQYITSTLSTIDDSFYRVETSETVPYNGPIYYGYKGIDVFLSTLSNSMADFFYDIGYGSGSTKKNTISYYSGNEVIDSLLGIKYHAFLGEEQIPTSYQLVASATIADEEIQIYENPYALSLGFMVSNDILEVEKDLNALTYQNNIFSAMTGGKYQIYDPIPLEKIDLTYEFDDQNRGKVCFYTAINSQNGYSKFSLYLNDLYLPKKEDFEIVCTEEIVSNHNQLRYEDLNESEYLGTFAAHYSHHQFEKAIEELKEHELMIEAYRGTYLKGSIEVDDDKTLLATTIPYDSNWQILVDGKKKKAIPLLENLLGVKLEKGKHTIEFRYQPKYFYLGLLISFISAIILKFLHQKKVFA